MVEVTEGFPRALAPAGSGRKPPRDCLRMGTSICGWPNANTLRFGFSATWSVQSLSTPEQEGGQERREGREARGVRPAGIFCQGGRGCYGH